MAFESYIIGREGVSSNPRKRMLDEKKKHVEYYYDLAIDREDDCKINGREFIKTPRIFDQKVKTNFFQTITMETIEKDDYFYSGDILDYDNNHWICTSSYVFHKLYCKGNLVKCNYLLKWQTDDGSIIERYCWVQSAAQYNSGETGNKTMVLGSDQLMIVLPKDDFTVQLNSPTGFFIDFNEKKPTPYKITRNDTVPYSDWDHGCINIVVTEKTYNPEKDRIDLMLCDYKEVATLPPRSDESNDSLAEISCKSPVVKIGALPSRFYAIFRDENGNEVEGVDSVWNIESDFEDKLISTIDNSCIMISVNDMNLVGEKFKLTLSDSDGMFDPFELIVLIETIF